MPWAALPARRPGVPRAAPRRECSPAGRAKAEAEPAGSEPPASVCRSPGFAKRSASVAGMLSRNDTADPVLLPPPAPEALPAPSAGAGPCPNRPPPAADEEPRCALSRMAHGVAAEAAAFTSVPRSRRPCQLGPVPSPPPPLVASAAARSCSSATKSSAVRAIVPSASAAPAAPAPPAAALPSAGSDDWPAPAPARLPLRRLARRRSVMTGGWEAAGAAHRATTASDVGSRDHLHMPSNAVSCVAPSVAPRSTSSASAGDVGVACSVPSEEQ
mmetsp:Transcript_19340/g.74172  ORF Transcript_19340/g.74172 Transcript_19340/m.74172 type:complete len:272 (-) Transcript_19340:170-985(-)